MSDANERAGPEELSRRPGPTGEAAGAAAGELGNDPREALKQRLEETRLPVDLKARILAESPSPEELERLYRQLQEGGGLSSEQFLAALGLEVEPHP